MGRKIKILSSLLLWHKGSLLLLRRARNFKGLDTGQGLWELPGGGIQLGRGPRGTAVKELEEETGLTLKRPPTFEDVLVYVVKAPRQTEHRVNTLYRAKYKGHLNDDILLGEEHDDYRLVHRAKDLDRLEMVQAVRTYLTRVLS
jgi:8-oxo-dGTP pyrophosphatase MutT (NUDIX family)